MQEFTFVQPGSPQDAIAAASAKGAKYIAGGTDLLQLMKDDVESPAQLVDLEPVGLSDIETDADGLRLGAMARMSDMR